MPAEDAGTAISRRATRRYKNGDGQGAASGATTRRRHEVSGVPTTGPASRSTGGQLCRAHDRQAAAGKPALRLKNPRFLRGAPKFKVFAVLRACGTKRNVTH